MKFIIPILAFTLSAFCAKAQPSIQWQQCYGGSNNEQCQSIRQTFDGGYVLAGWAYSTDGEVTGNHGGGDFWVVKISVAGALEWEKCYGGSGYDDAYDVRQTADSGFIVVGTTASNDGDVSGNHGGYDDIWVIKTSSSGILQWQRCLGGSDREWGNAVAQTADGGYIVAGGTVSVDGDVTGNHGSEDVWLVKLSASGGILWEKTYGGSTWEEAVSVQQTMDGGIVFGGSTNSVDGDVVGLHGADTNTTDIWVVKLTDLGAIQWQHPLGGALWEGDGYTIQTMDSGYLAVGFTNTDGGGGDVTGFVGDYTNRDGWAVKLDKNGAVQWDRCVAVTGSEFIQAVTQSADGEYFFCGLSNFHADYSALYGNISAYGALGYADTFGSNGGGDFCGIAPMGSGSAIAAGTIQCANGEMPGYYGRDQCWVVSFGWGSGVATLQEPDTLSIAPNPAGAMVEVASRETITSIAIADMLGRTVYSGVFGCGKAQIDVSGLRPGIYVVEVNGGHAGRLVKE